MEGEKTEEGVGQKDSLGVKVLFHCMQQTRAGIPGTIYGFQHHQGSLLSTEPKAEGREGGKEAFERLIRSPLKSGMSGAGETLQQVRHLLFTSLT